MGKLEVMNKNGNWTIIQVHLLRVVQSEKHRHPQIQTYNDCHTQPPNTIDMDGHIDSKPQGKKANSFLLIAQK